MESEIAEFYREETLLVMGGSGFVGKVLVEKLLRCCRPRTLYLLLRVQKDRTVEDRLHTLFQSEVFDRLKAEVPDFWSTVKGVKGDLSVEGMGMEEEAARLLEAEVTVVFHGAATVDFTDGLNRATLINVLGAENVVHLCRRIQNLKGLVYLSTGYCHCVRGDPPVEEKFYQAPVLPGALIHAARNADPMLLEIISPKLLGEWPNSYTFTKAVAERVMEEAAELPLAILRLPIVNAALREPMPGWLDGVNGAVAIMTGVYTGYLRAVYGNQQRAFDFTPVDHCANATIAIGYSLSREQRVGVLNLSPGAGSPPQAEHTQRLVAAAQGRPWSRALLYFEFLVTSNWTLFCIYNLFLHALPCLLADFILRIKGRKPKYLRLAAKALSGLKTLKFFAEHSGYFEISRTNKLWESLGPGDKELVPFDSRSLDWEEMAEATITGVRRYILKDPDSTIRTARKRFYRLYAIFQGLKVTLVALMVWLLWGLLRSTLMP